MAQVVLTTEQFNSIKDLALAFSVFAEAVEKKGSIEKFAAGIEGIEEKIAQKNSIQADIDALLVAHQDLGAQKQELESINEAIANCNRELKQLESDVLERREQKLVLEKAVEAANIALQEREEKCIERENVIGAREKVCGAIEDEIKDLKEQLKAYQDKEARVKAAIGE